MKKIIILIGLITMSCNSEKKEINYYKLIDQHISSNEIKDFLNELGSDYEFDDSYKNRYYIYKDKGIELSFTKTDTLKAIFFRREKLSQDFILPYNIKITANREEIEQKIGKPDKYFVGLRNLNSYYLNEHLVVRYKSKDTVNLNNPFETITVTELDKEKVMAD